MSNGYGWQYPEEGYPEGTKSYLGQAGFENEQIQALLNNPQLAQILGQLQKGFDPRVREQLGSLKTQRQNLLDPSQRAFTPEMGAAYRDYVTGGWLESPQMGKSLRMQAEEASQPMWKEMTSGLAGRGLMGSGGEVASMYGSRGKAMTESMLRNMGELRTMGATVGTTGLGEMGRERLGLEELGAQIGEWIPSFIEESQQGRMGIGTNIAGLQMGAQQGLIGMSQQERLQPKQKKRRGGLAGFFADIAPAAIGAATGGWGGLGASLLSNLFGGGQQDYSSVEMPSPMTPEDVYGYHSPYRRGS